MNVPAARFDFAPLPIERAGAKLAKFVQGLCGVLLLLMVIFTVYTVVMRYVFHNPPFWGDTVSVFCNIWVTMLGYSLAVRDREEIALRGFYKLLPPKAAFLLDTFWSLLVLAFGVYLAWFGWITSQSVPGIYWELGGLKKSWPMLIMPIAGTLIALAAALLVLEDWLVLTGRRRARAIEASGTEII